MRRTASLWARLLSVVFQRFLRRRNCRRMRQHRVNCGARAGNCSVDAFAGKQQGAFDALLVVTIRPRAGLQRS